MRKILAITAAAGAMACVPAVAYAASTEAVTCRATFSGHPENSSPPWAYDNFTRKTAITPGDAPGTWTAHIADNGHFTTVVGATSDNGDKIVRHTTGKFSGSGDYTITSTAQPKCIKGESYGGSDGPSTSQWPGHYFGDSPTVVLVKWHWDYVTRCEQMHEDSVTGTTGHMTGARDCTTPTPTPTPTPSDSAPEPSDSPEPSASATTPAGEAPAPTPVKTDLPVTG